MMGRYDLPASFNSSNPFQSIYLVVLSFELPPNDEYVLLNFMLSQRNKAILKHKFTLEEGELLLVATISDPASWANATRIILPALRGQNIWYTNIFKATCMLTPTKPEWENPYKNKQINYIGLTHQALERGISFNSIQTIEAVYRVQWKITSWSNNLTHHEDPIRKRNIFNGTHPLEIS